jgi:hypothetical protein
MSGRFSSTWTRSALAPAAVVCLVAGLVSGTQSALAQQESPFRELDEQAARRKKPAPPPVPPPLSPMNGEAATSSGGFGTPYPGAATADQSRYGAPGSYQAPGPSTATGPGAVERMDLPPIGEGVTPPSSIGSTTTMVVDPASRRNPPSNAPNALATQALPGDIWRGLDLPQIEQLVARANVPPRSPALYSLWQRLLTSTATPPAGSNPIHLRAVQMEGLYRSGALAELSQALDRTASDSKDPLLATFRIRRDLAAGDRQGVCTATKSLIQVGATLPKPMRAELHLLGGYCAATEKNAAAAGLAVELAREDGIDAPLALAVLDSIAGGAAPNLALPKRILVLDYRLLETLGPVDASQIIDKAEPALLTALASPSTADTRLRAMAAEAASRINAIAPVALADAYRAVQSTPDTDSDATVRQALVLQAIDREAPGPRRDQLARVFLEDARKSGLVLAASTILTDLGPTALTSVSVELAAETALAAGDFTRARSLAGRQTAVAHWAALADVFDPNLRGTREQNLAALDDVTRRVKFSGDALHKLATVLDALDINVPMALWEAASRAPQPANGFLPETGVLGRLDDAAKKNEVARTILLGLGSLGPNGADGAHIIALGDTIRALRRVGLDADARRVGLEAVLGVWPRAQPS